MAYFEHIPSVRDISEINHTKIQIIVFSASAYQNVFPRQFEFNALLASKSFPNYPT